jgi:hypothetical protein
VSITVSIVIVTDLIVGDLLSHLSKESSDIAFRAIITFADRGRKSFFLVKFGG